MKIFYYTLITIFFSYGSLWAQWSEINDNHTTGKLGIGKPAPNKDIDILRSNSLAGIDIYNTNTTGRSTVLVGEGNSGRYIYLGYQNANHVSGLGAFKPASGIIYTGAPNGMRLISSNYFSFTAGGLEESHERLRITPGGRVGIGIAQPATKLHIYDNSENDHHDLAIFAGHTIDGLNADRFNRILVRNRNGQQSWLGIEGSGSNAIGYLGIEHWQDASPAIALSWNKNGNVGIGTTDPDAKLAVNGDIHAKEVKVDLNGWPDFVFNKDYTLPTLEDVETHIKENGHLKDIPSEAEVKANGINLGEMDAKLLQKIEELTLYVIELKKGQEQLKKENSELRKNIQTLKKQI